MKVAMFEKESYFENVDRPGLQTGDSTPVSPCTIPERIRKTHSSSERPSYHIRSKSDYSVFRSRYKVQTIEEDVTTRILDTRKLSADQIESSTEQSNTPPPTQAKQTPIQSSSATSSLGSIRSIIQPRQNKLESNKYSPVDFPPHKPRSGHKWERTTSGSVWYEKPTSSQSQSVPSSGSSRIWIPLSHDEPLQTLQVPLRPPPPLVSVIPDGPRIDRIKVEKSFTQNGPKNQDSLVKPVLKAQHTSKKSSINPRRIFSAPFMVIRRLSQSVQKPKASPIITVEIPIPDGHAELPGHNSQPKMTQTSDALEQVSSILYDMEASKRAQPAKAAAVPSTTMFLDTRTKTSISSISKESKKVIGGHMKMIRGILSPLTISNARSIEVSESASYTSSQRRMKLGLEPNTTPEENAIYKIKRSPSAETETFFKVDISIYGRTSYLPSEARRIHTPPLPEDYPGGKKREPFSYYNDPCDRDKVGNPDTENEAANDGILEDCIPVKKSIARMMTVGKLFSHGVRKQDDFHHKSNWSATKIAEPEPFSEYGIMAIKKVNTHDRDQTNDLDQKKEYENCENEIYPEVEEIFDQSIPEHLPSSPLCPRHPRYWRVVKGKGSQFRGCWMHGVGIYDQQPAEALLPENIFPIL